PYGEQDDATRTWSRGVPAVAGRGTCAAPSLTVISVSSGVACTTAALQASGLRTTTATTVFSFPGGRQVSVKPGQSAGMHGRTTSVSPCSSATPSTDSSATRYIHPDDPVYQVQPPRPTCG